MKNNEPYKTALNAAQTHPAAIAALGEPVKPGLLPTGKINLTGNEGDADIAVPVSGPKAKGKVYIVGTKSAGKWTYTTFELALEGQEERIPLNE